MPMLLGSNWCDDLLEQLEKYRGKLAVKVCTVCPDELAIMSAKMDRFKAYGSSGIKRLKEE